MLFGGHSVKQIHGTFHGTCLVGTKKPKQLQNYFFARIQWWNTEHISNFG